VAELGHQGALDTHTAIGQAWMALCWARAAALRGDLAVADQRYAEAGAAADTFPGLVRWAMGGRLVVAAQRGDSTACAPLEQSLADAPGSALLLLEPEVEAARGWSAAAQGHMSRARTRFEEAYDRATREGATTIAVGVAHDAYRATGDPAGCGAAADAVLGQAAATDSPLAVARARHLVAAAALDAPALEAAANSFATLGAALLAAEAWTTAAAAWSRAGDQRAANRATQRAGGVGASSPDAATPLLGVGQLVAPLTAREQEAIGLARRGLATKEIAVRMGVRPRTADNHLHRAYEKLGITGKADLHPPG
jgi:DNA-binding CsgD family transcriptional regulator